MSALWFVVGLVCGAVVVLTLMVCMALLDDRLAEPANFDRKFGAWLEADKPKRKAKK